MCGICGFTGAGDKKQLHLMLESIKHRGLDGQGVFEDSLINLGHVRLSIIDLSKNGIQPLSNEEGDIWITYNGEVYNYIELKNLLKKKHDFSSRTDTEVLVHLYEEKGIEFVKDCNGMFSFGLYDAKKKKVFLVRDRIGIKPLYYTISEDKSLIFASEIKSILQHHSITPTLNQNALSTFLKHRANLSKETFFSNIFSLEPGTILEYDLNSKTHKIYTYWDLPNFQSKFSFSKAKSLLAKDLSNSVQLRLRSDVNVGLFLSGGIDSNTILSQMSEHQSKELHTFTLSFENYDSSDDNFSRANQLYSSINQHNIVFREKDFSILSDVMYHLDEPQADPTCLANYQLSHFASKKVKVVLTGEGSDEIFGGYPYYKFLKYKNIYRRLPKLSRDFIENNLDKIPMSVYNYFLKYAKQMGNSMYPRIKDFLEKPSFDAYKSLTQIYTNDEYKKIINFPTEEKEVNVSNFNINSELRSLSHFELKNTLVNNLLMKVDKMSMAHSLESRVPFLDHNIVEFGYSLPFSYKVKLFKEKYILRQAMKKELPSNIVRNKKEYFFVPIHNWFKSGFSDHAEQILDSRIARKLFKPAKVNSLINNAKNGSLYDSRQLWSLVSFQTWYDSYFKD